MKSSLELVYTLLLYVIFIDLEVVYRGDPHTDLGRSRSDVARRSTGGRIERDAAGDEGRQTQRGTGRTWKTFLISLLYNKTKLQERDTVKYTARALPRRTCHSDRTQCFPSPQSTTPRHCVRL